jgi:hypothetical protein
MSQRRSDGFAWQRIKEMLGPDLPFLSSPVSEQVSGLSLMDDS